jgi:hypothetical protein
VHYARFQAYFLVNVHRESYLFFPNFFSHLSSDPTKQPFVKGTEQGKHRLPQVNNESEREFLIEWITKLKRQCRVLLRVKKIIFMY